MSCARLPWSAGVAGRPGGPRRRLSSKQRRGDGGAPPALTPFPEARAKRCRVLRGTGPAIQLIVSRYGSVCGYGMLICQRPSAPPEHVVLQDSCSVTDLVVQSVASLAQTSITMRYSD